MLSKVSVLACAWRAAALKSGFAPGHSPADNTNYPRQSESSRQERLENDLDSPSEFDAPWANPAAGIDVKRQRQHLMNFGDVQYVTYMTVGGQTVTGIVDTGSFDLVVFSKTCGSCGLAAKFDPWASSSYKAGKLMTVQSYGSGDTYSVEASDFVSMGPFADKNQTFWEVISAKMPVLANAAFQTIIGVGPPETPASDAWDAAQESFTNISWYFGNSSMAPIALGKQVKETVDAAVEVMKSPTMLDNFKVSTFSLCLGVKPGSDGYLIWDDMSPWNQPELFKKVPVLGKHTWSAPLANVRLEHSGNTSGVGPINIGCQDGCSALMDSGTSLLAVPTSVADAFEAAITSLHTDCSNLNTLPDLVFELGGQRFTMAADAYVAEVTKEVPKMMQSFIRVREIDMHRTDNEGGRCHLLLMESFADSAYGPLWIFGMPFFRRFYTAFHTGEDHASRAFYVAPASEDCQPVTEEAARSSTYRRKVDPTKLYVPNSVVKAATSRFVNL